MCDVCDKLESYIHILDGLDAHTEMWKAAIHELGTNPAYADDVASGHFATIQQADEEAQRVNFICKLTTRYAAMHNLDPVILVTIFAGAVQMEWSSAHRKKDSIDRKLEEYES